MNAILLCFWACSAKPPSTEAAAPPVEEPVAVEPGPVEPAPVEPPTDDPKALYAACEKRVEQPQSEGECTTDADCTRTGCSSEICTTTAMAAELMTTCEVQPCFAVLDACGCHDGQCTWTVRP